MVPGRPLSLGSRCIAARLLVCSVATCVPQQIRNSRGGAVMRTRFADIPLDKGSAISAAPGAGTIAEMVAGIFACFIAGIAEGISKTFPQSWLCPIQHPSGGRGAHSDRNGVPFSTHRGVRKPVFDVPKKMTQTKTRVFSGFGVPKIGTAKICAM